MSLHDKTMIFLNSKPAGTASKVIDFRFNGGLEDHLYFHAAFVGRTTGQTATVILQDSDDGETWNDVHTYESGNGNDIAAERLPANLQRFVRVETEGTGDPVLFAEVTDTIDREITGVRFQNDTTRDVGAEGDAVLNPPPPEGEEEPEPSPGS